MSIHANRAQRTVRSRTWTARPRHPEKAPRPDSPVLRIDYLSGNIAEFTRLVLGHLDLDDAVEYALCL